MMRSNFALASALLLVAGMAVADEGTKSYGSTTKTQGMSMTGKQMTLTGEIVDLGCYMQEGSKGAKYEQHAEEAIDKGMPMGLVTTDGTLYVLTMSESRRNDNDGNGGYSGNRSGNTGNGGDNDEAMEAFEKAKDMAAETVRVSGSVYERGGIRAIEVMSVEPMSSGGSGASGHPRG